MASPWLCGFRFITTDEDLVHFYLQRKVDGQPLPPGLITHCDIYAGNPWEILANVKNFDGYYYVFTNLKRMSKNKIDRRAGSGTCKGQTTNRFSQAEGKPQWARKAFVFEVQKKNSDAVGPNNGRWHMVEYSVGDEGFDGKTVLCKIYNKHARDLLKGNQNPTKKTKKQTSCADDDEGDQNPRKKKKQNCTADDEEFPIASDFTSNIVAGPGHFRSSNLMIEPAMPAEDGAAFSADEGLNSLLDFSSDHDLSSLLSSDMDVGTGTSPGDELSKCLAENIYDGGFFSSMPPGGFFTSMPLLTTQCNKDNQENKDDENGDHPSSLMPPRDFWFPWESFAEC